MPKDDFFQDFCSCLPPRLYSLDGDFHNDLFPKYAWKDSTPPPDQPDERSRLGYSSEDGDSQQEETGPLLIPDLNHLNEVFLVWGEGERTLPT